MSITLEQPLVIAVPKGRILKEIHPLFDGLGVTLEDAFYDEDSRLLQFATSHPLIRIIRVRSFDVATFVAFGAAQLGVAGSDVLQEFDYQELYAPLDLNIGHCRISLARVAGSKTETLTRRSHIRVATKYPNITRRFFAQQGIQAECVKLGGAIELAPVLGLSSHIVDLVSTGNTLKANGLEEATVIDRVSSRLIVNRTALKTRNVELSSLIARCRTIVEASLAPAP
jgi:ATP phosphoribosyltransferase